MTTPAPTRSPVPSIHARIAQDPVLAGLLDWRLLTPAQLNDPAIVADANQAWDAWLPDEWGTTPDTQGFPLVIIHPDTSPPGQGDTWPPGTLGSIVTNRPQHCRIGTPTGPTLPVAGVMVGYAIATTIDQAQALTRHLTVNPASRAGHTGSQSA